MENKINQKEIERKRLLAFQFFYLEIKETIKELEKKLDGLKFSEVPSEKEKCHSCHCHGEKSES
jgi:hypothetical protein